jgi:hypothetical protein
MVMDATWKAKWVEALRSGEYKQGNSKLRPADDEFCCLGVLCDVVAKHSSVPSLKWQQPWGREWYFGTGSAGAVLPDEVMEIAGIGDDLGDCVCFDGTSLSERNDEGASFLEIADLIEKHL